MNSPCPFRGPFSTGASAPHINRHGGATRSAFELYDDGTGERVASFCGPDGARKALWLAVILNHATAHGATRYGPGGNR